MGARSGIVPSIDCGPAWRAWRGMVRQGRALLQPMRQSCFLYDVVVCRGTPTHANNCASPAGLRRWGISLRSTQVAPFGRWDRAVVVVPPCHPASPKEACRIRRVFGQLQQTIGWPTRPENCFQNVARFRFFRWASDWPKRSKPPAARATTRPHLSYRICHIAGPFHSHDGAFHEDIIASQRAGRTPQQPRQGGLCSSWSPNVAA